MNNFSKWISAWLLIGCFLNMGGCATATIGRPFPASNVGQLQLSVSTVEDAHRLLGDPHQVETNQAGEQLLIWQYVRSDATSGFASVDVKTSQQLAALVFSPSGRLLRVGRLINTPAPLAAPSAPHSTTGSDHALQTRESVQEQLDELNQMQLPYQEYQRRYREITGH
ncbi:hypothetical protein [Pseudomonas aeruginosa]|uniref:hypothetical protein n=1 Tax=Pseudomonas aeruginosa TaxID=287 RepID=UPI002F42D214